MWDAAQALIIRLVAIGFGLAIMRAAYGTPGVILGCIAAAAAWGGSLHFKEWQKCPKCKGKSMLPGLVASNSLSFCPRCEGTSGRVVRWGVRFLRPGRARELLSGVDRSVWRG